MTIATSVLALFWARTAAQGGKELVAVHGKIHDDTARASQRSALAFSARSQHPVETPAETAARVRHHCRSAGCRNWDCSCECAGCGRARR